MLPKNTLSGFDAVSSTYGTGKFIKIVYKIFLGIHIERADRNYVNKTKANGSTTILPQSKKDMAQSTEPGKVCKFIVYFIIINSKKSSRGQKAKEQNFNFKNLMLILNVQILLIISFFIKIYYWKNLFF